MSDSRLEKFIYAICSMDVSDLPVPLSRIEKLWNCLITGETPDFEPLSRNEKYLMAMLDRYDISNLPAPMSRGEKLLYKIVVGETDLSDVPGYLSRYEELLKYLIENGGIGFEYVLYTINQSLYTLYTTAEKPVKSAILKGNTILVNEENNEEKIEYEPFTLERGYFNLQTTNGVLTEITDDNFANSTTSWYTPVFNRCSAVMTFQSDAWNGFRIVYYDNEKKPIYVLRKNDNPSNVLTLSTPLNAIYFRISTYTDKTIRCVSNKDYLKLHSVKMPVLTTTGKNLFDGELEIGKINPTTGENQVNSTMVRSKNFVKVKPSTTYTLSYEVDQSLTNVAFYGSNKEFLGVNLTESSQVIGGSLGRYKKILTTNNTHYLRFYSNSVLTITDTSFKSQLEESPTPTTYEPFKSNILTVNEGVELGCVGGVKDELDLTTGELTENTFELTFNGSENWQMYTYEGQSTKRFRLALNHRKTNDDVPAVICDKIMATPNNQWKQDMELIEADGTLVSIRKNINTLKEFTDWLSVNNIVCRFLKKQPSIKTVDLTTVDQDGQPTKLKTYNDVTHVEINADNLIPSVDVEVATKISETLSIMEPQQIDISNTQNKLGQTIDEQSKNTDATMLATTEIYEQTL